MALSDLTDLVSYWRFNKFSGTVEDVHGSNDLAWNVAQKGGGANYFTGYVADYSIVPDNASVSVGDIDFAWAGWVRMTAVGDSRVFIAKGDLATTSVEYGLWYRSATQRIRFEVSDGATVSAVEWGSAAVADTWYFVYAYHDATANEIGLDINNSGSPVTAAWSNGVQDGTSDLLFGFGTLAGTDKSLYGFLGSFGYWRGGLPSGATLTSIYNSGNGKAFAALSAGEKTDMESWWDLSEPQGIAYDSIGSNNLIDGRRRRGPVGNSSDGILRASLFYSGESAALADNASLSTGDVDFCIAVWVNAAAYSANMPIVTKDSVSSNREYWLIYYHTAQRFVFSVSSNGSAVASENADVLGVPVANAWYLIFAWHDSTANTINIQVNNGTVDSGAYSSGVYDGASPFTVGAWAGGALGSYWNGFIGPVMFWKGSIPTADERTELWNSGLGLDYPFTDTQFSSVGTSVATNGYGNYGQNAELSSQKISQIDIGGTVYEAITYWDSSRYLVVATRTAGGSWTAYTMNGAGGRPTVQVTANDNHHTTALGIDPNGYIHVAYNMHADPLLYRVSNAAIDSWTGVLGAASSMLGTNESSVTYPNFFNNPSGKLYFMFRDGSAGNADTYLYEYDESGTSWGSLTGLTAGKLINGKSSTDNAYPAHPPAFDSDFGSGGHLHISWVWRSAGGGSFNYDVSYVRWDGTNWEQSDGTSQTIPITPSNDEAVITVVTESGLRATPQIYSDSSGNPHIVYARHNTSGASSVYHVYHNGSAWQTPTEVLSGEYQFIDLTAPELPYDKIPLVAIDRATDTVYMVTNGYGLGTGLYLYASASPYTSWQQSTITTAQLHSWMPTFNMVKWEADKILQLPLMPFLSLGHDTDAYPIRLLEYTPTPITAGGWAWRWWS